MAGNGVTSPTDALARQAEAVTDLLERFRFFVVQPEVHSQHRCFPRFHLPEQSQLAVDRPGTMFPW
jgi:hypothetical protein